MTQRYAYHSPESLREGVLILERHHPPALAQNFHREAVSQSQRCVTNWSGKRDLNSRPSPWQGDALPLSYSRSITVGARGGILLSRNETVKRPERHCS